MSLIRDLLSSVADTASEVTNYLADNSLNGMVGWVYNLYCEASISATVAYTEKFSPDVTTFIDYVGSMTHYEEYMQALSTTLAFGIFIFYIALTALKKIRLSDIQETLPTLTGKLILVLIGIANYPLISNALFEMMNYIYMALQEYNFDTSIDFAEAMIKLFIPIGLSTLLTPNNILKYILCIIFGIIFIKEFINLLLEVIERYIVACLLKYSFSLPLATCVTKNTSAVFKKYIQMYLCQCLMLVLNTIMVNMVIQMVLTADSMGTLIGWMFMYSFIKVCQRIDGYLFTMGLSVAVTGGNVADQVGQTFRGMIQTARTGGQIVGAGAELGAVKLRSNALSNDSLTPDSRNSMMKTASMLDNIASGVRGNFSSIKPDNVANRMQDVIKTGGIDQAVNYAKTITPDQLDASMVSDIQTGNKSKLGIYNSMSDDTKRVLANQAHNLDAFVPQGASVDNLEFGMNGSLKGRMTYQDATGTHQSDFEISRSATSKSLQEDSGFYFSSTGGMKTGETVAYSNDNNNGISSAEVLMGKNLDNVSSSVLENTQSITRTEDGFVLSKGVTGDAADILAKMTDKGEVFYAQDTTLTSEQLENRPWAKDLQNVRMHNNGDGTIDVIGQQVKSHGSDKDELEYRHFRLYNRAVFDDKNVLNADKAKYIGSFNAHENSGAYMVGEMSINRKDESAMAKIQNSWEDFSSAIDSSPTNGFKI